MGWCEGSYLANDVWKKIEKYIPDSDKKTVAKEIVELFEDHDADDWCGTDIDKIANPEDY